MKRFVGLLGLTALAGCIESFGGGAGAVSEFEVEVAPLPGPAPGSTAPRGQVEEVERVFLGFTIARLGDASNPGFWLETPLVSSTRQGTVVSERGLVLPVTLLPAGGSRGDGSRMSFAAFRALGIDVETEPTLTVNANVDPS